MYIETPDAVLNVLRPAIKRSSVGYVSFTSDGTPKSWKLAEFIEDVIQTNHKVTDLAFGSVMLSNEEWKTICNAIRVRARQSSIVDYLELTECFAGGISTDVLKGILIPNLEELRLDRNGMSSQEASTIAEFLNSDPPLARLHLRDNRFDDADAAVLANSISSNTNLRTIDVERNNIKEEGRLAFLRAIFDVTSLASFAASNHTCRVWELPQDISAVNGFTDASLNKWEKIFAMLALSNQDPFINTALLSGVPVSLMPVLLDEADGQDEEGYSQITDLYLELANAKRCQKHDDWDNLGNTKPLNCVYGLMRSWVVPMIYV